MERTKMKNLVIILMTLTLAACASKAKQQAETEAQVQAEEAKRPRFEQGLKALDTNRFQDAAKIFDGLLVSKPGTELDLITLYNSGAAYEGMGDCARAAERFREVVRSSAGKYKRIEAQAFYHLSFMYECLGQDNKSIAALLDARKRASDLSFAVAYAEIPARLAAGYARIGNRVKALEYFALADKGLKKIVAAEEGHRQHQILAQSLFYMGQLNPAQRRAEGNPIAFLQGLSLQQPYLLQSVEMNSQPWSQRSAEDLETAYDNIFKFKIDDGAQRREFYTRAVQVCNELIRIRSPKTDKAVDDIYARVDNTLSKLNSEMAKVAETNRLTPEAQKRDSLKKQGRLVDPAPPKKPLRKKR
jgi:tetratricopeptide (TPR) repeat protein